LVKFSVNRAVTHGILKLKKLGHLLGAKSPKIEDLAYKVGSRIWAVLNSRNVLLNENSRS